MYISIYVCIHTRKAWDSYNIEMDSLAVNSRTKIAYARVIAAVDTVEWIESILHCSSTTRKRQRIWVISAGILPTSAMLVQQNCNKKLMTMQTYKSLQHHI